MLGDSAARKCAKQEGEEWGKNRAGRAAQGQEKVRRAYQGLEGSHQRKQTVGKVEPGKNPSSGTMTDN